jgi:hypothetical protein
MTHLLLKQTVKPLAFQARDHPTYDVDARPKKGPVFESVLADGILAAHCRPNGKLGTSVERAAFGQNTSLLMAEEVTRPIEQFGHIVARPGAASLVCAAIVFNYGYML